MKIRDVFLLFCVFVMVFFSGCQAREKFETLENMISRLEGIYQGAGENTSERIVISSETIIRFDMKEVFPEQCDDAFYSKFYNSDWKSFSLADYLEKGNFNISEEKAEYNLKKSEVSQYFLKENTAILLDKEGVSFIRTSPKSQYPTEEMEKVFEEYKSALVDNETSFLIKKAKENLEKAKEELTKEMAKSGSSSYHRSTASKETVATASWNLYRGELKNPYTAILDAWTVAYDDYGRTCSKLRYLAQNSFGAYVTEEVYVILQYCDNYKIEHKAFFASKTLDGLAILNQWGEDPNHSNNEESTYQQVLSSLKNEFYESAIKYLQKIPGYKNSYELLAKCQECKSASDYVKKIEFFENGAYTTAKQRLSTSTYLDSKRVIDLCDYFEWKKQQESEPYNQTEETSNNQEKTPIPTPETQNRTPETETANLSPETTPASGETSAPATPIATEKSEAETVYAPQTHVHTYGNWIVSKAATETAEGEQYRVCSGCGNKETKKVPMLSHVHRFSTEWKKDSAYHWNTCLGCGEQGNKAEHRFSEWTITKKATIDEAGEKQRKCSICEYTEIQVYEYYSEGLSFQRINNGYSLSGIGNCFDSVVVVPSQYNGLPVTEINDSVFRDNKNITAIYLPNTITRIGNFAFDYCTNLSFIRLGNAVEAIGRMAFRFSAIKTMHIPDSVVSIGEHAFSYCDKLETIRLSENLTSISNGLFYLCSSLKTITIPNSISTIGAEAFYKCENLEEVYLPSSLVEIEGQSFANCSKLKEINFPTGLTSLGAYAFDNCKSLKEIVIPTSVFSIGQHCFRDCHSLTSAKIEGKLSTLTGTFKSCENLESVSLPGTITNLGPETFENCRALKTIDFNGSTDTWASIKWGYYCNSNSGEYIVHCINGNLPKTSMT